MVMPGETVGGSTYTCSECKAVLELQVCQSANGHFLGFWCDTDGACGRESGYFPTALAATQALLKYQDTGVMEGART